MHPASHSSALLTRHAPPVQLCCSVCLVWTGAVGRHFLLFVPDTVSVRVCVCVRARACVTMAAPQRLASKVALVTAAGSGIGRAIAVQFASEGADVVVNDLAPAEGEVDTAAETAELCRNASAARGGKAIHIHTDVSDRAAVQAMVEHAAAQMGRIDVRLW